MSLTLDEDPANDVEAKDRFDDACGEALRILLTQHPDLKRAVIAGVTVKDQAERIFMDIAIDDTTLACRLSVEVLIDHQEDGITSTAGQRVTRQTELEAIDDKNIAQMLVAMSLESRKNLIDYLLRGGMENMLGAKYEREKDFSAGNTVRNNVRELRNWMMDLMN